MKTWNPKTQHLGSRDRRNKSLSPAWTTRDPDLKKQNCYNLFVKKRTKRIKKKKILFQGLV